MSRFEGGSWVRAGFLLTYTAFAYGCVVVSVALTRLRRPTGLTTNRAERIAALAALATVGSLALPAIEFPDETLDGFRGLDVLSVVIAVLLAFVVAASAWWSSFHSLVAPAATCLTGVLAGNLLIQRFTTRGTSVAYGLWSSTGLAGVCLVAALVGVRGQREAHR